MGDWLSSTIDGAVDSATNVFSARQNEENQRRGHRQQDRHAKQKYQWMMGDMKAAGLNPILAAGGGNPGAAGGGGGAAGGVHASNRHSSTSARSLMKDQKELVKSQTKKSDFDSLNSWALAQYNGAKAAQEGIYTQYAKDHPLFFLMDRGAGGAAINAGVTAAKGAAGLANMIKKWKNMDFQKSLAGKKSYTSTTTSGPKGTTHKTTESGKY